MTVTVTRPATLDAEMSRTLEREKALFMTRNSERCSHVLVRVGPLEVAEDLHIIAAFTFGETRNWQKVEALVPLTELYGEEGPDRCLITAFDQLDDGISAARIARLFAPLSVAQRMAATRHD